MDIEPQPNYPFEFHQADALTTISDPKWWHAEAMVRGYVGLLPFDAIHASPPCQHDSKTKQIWDREHPDLVAATRELLDATGLPYVIENVKGAPLHNAQLLEGQMFGLNTHRPRLFETNWGFEAPHLRPPPPRQAKMGRLPKPGEAIQVVGHVSDIKAAREAMGIDWMTRDELAEAIPPAYTEFIGFYLLGEVNLRLTTSGAAA